MQIDSFFKITLLNALSLYGNKLPGNTTGATSGAGTAYPSGAPEFSPGF